MKEIIALITEWVRERAMSPNTQRFYELELTRFGSWIQMHGYSLSTLSSVDIQSYLTVLQHEPEDQRSQFHVRRKKALSLQSIEQTRRTIHAFFEWGVRKGHFVRNPLWEERGGVINQRMPDSEPRPKATSLTREITQLLRANGDDLSGEKILRVATIAHLAFWAGASREEIAKLKVDDFCHANGAATISLPTPSKESAKILIPNHSASIIYRYLQSRGDAVPSIAEAPLVTSLKSHDPVTGWSVRHILRGWQHKKLPEDRSHQVVGPRQLRMAFQGLALEKFVQERIIARHHRIRQLQTSIEPLASADTTRLHKAVTQALAASWKR